MAQFTVTPREYSFELELKQGTASLSRLAVIPYRQRIGTAWVTMGGIAGVVTPTRHRLKGYARELLENSVQWLKDEGFHWSGLFGIPNFYHRFGYVSSLPDSRVSIPTRNAEAAKLRHQIRPWHETDVSDSLDIYNRENACRTGTVERDPDKWRGFRKAVAYGSVPTVDVATDGYGAMRGYIVRDDGSEKVDVAEVAAYSPSVYESLLAHLADLAIERRVENITIRVVADHPFARLCARLGCSQTTTHPIRREGMWRILNQLSLFEAISSELSCRLANAGWRESCSLILRTELGELCLDIAGTKIGVSAATTSGAPWGYRIRISQMELTQVLMGFFSLRETLESCFGRVETPYEALFSGCDMGYNTDPTPTPGPATDQIVLPSRLARLCDILFPRQLAMLWHPDQF